MRSDFMPNNIFTFVILHYLNFDDTLRCVNSILDNVNYPDYNIVVVDNGSPNDSGKKLESHFGSKSEIQIILNQENLGFARGNNVGYKYAKETLKSDFIALINNDTIIDQPDFIERVLQQFSRSRFHVLGPDIISLKDGHHQNPRPATLQDKEVLKKYLINYRLSLTLNYIFLDKILEQLKKKIFPKPLLLPPVDFTAQDHNQEKLHAKLHGSALIFSPLYIAKYDGLNPDTFMYSEEAILFYQIRLDGLISIYDPKIKIWHKEDASTERMMGAGYKKRRFYLKNCLKSGKVLLKLMNESPLNSKKNQ